MFREPISRNVVALTMICVPAVSIAQGSSESVWIPMESKGFFGTREIRLEATLYRPDGPGPFPIVIFNHGSSGGPIPATYTETAMGFASLLTSRGIALLIPMRSGRGKSEGSNNEEPSACTLDAAKQGIGHASAALDAALSYVRKQPWIAMDSVVLAGHSRGGVLSVIYAGNHPGVAKGVINFAGGWKNDSCGSADINAALFEEAGRTSKVPQLFIYAHGDGFYSDASIEKYVSVFKAGGADVDFRFYKLDRLNGHTVFHKALPVWEKDVEAFLVRTGVARKTN